MFFCICYRRNACANSLAAFFFGDVGAKKKARKKETHKGNFALCGGRPTLRALDPRKLLKKFDQNFHLVQLRCVLSNSCEKSKTVRRTGAMWERHLAAAGGVKSKKRKPLFLEAFFLFGLWTGKFYMLSTIQTPPRRTSMRAQLPVISFETPNDGFLRVSVALRKGYFPPSMVTPLTFSSTGSREK